MRIAPSVSAGTVLPSTVNVNDKLGESPNSASQPEQPACEGRTAIFRLPVRPPSAFPPLPIAWGGEAAITFGPEDALPVEDDPRAMIPFTLELVRPPRRDGGAAVQWFRSFEQPAQSDPSGVLFARLMPGEPYRLSLDGRQLAACDATALDGCPQAVLTIRGQSTARLLRLIAIHEVLGASQDDLVWLPTAAGLPFEIDLDGRYVGGWPEK